MDVEAIEQRTTQPLRITESSLLCATAGTRRMPIIPARVWVPIMVTTNGAAAALNSSIVTDSYTIGTLHRQRNKSRISPKMA